MYLAMCRRRLVPGRFRMVAEKELEVEQGRRWVQVDSTRYGQTRLCVAEEAEEGPEADETPAGWLNPQQQKERYCESQVS